MRKLFAIATLIMGTIMMVSCSSDDGGGVVVTVVSVSAPTSVSDLANGATGQTVDFTVAVDASTTATWTASGSNVTIPTNSGDVEGSTVTVTFDAGTTAGAASVTLTVTDANDVSGSATAVFNVLEVGDNAVTIDGIPAAATLVVGGTLAVSGVTLDAPDGLAGFEASVNGGSAIDLSTLSGFTAGNTTATVDLSFTTADLGAVEGNNEIVFTASDTDGDEANFTHVLVVEPLAFDIEDISDLDTNGDGDATAEAAKEISGTINSDFTFDDDQTWVLAGRIKVTNGATLTIEPGAVIKGREGSGQNATALLITRGSSINAVGTAALPIIMTSIQDEILVSDVAAGNYASPNLDETINGLWGGLIVLGNAVISASDTEVQIEGIPTSDTDGLYGGDDDADDSGDIAYVSVRHGGSNIGSGNEINGITLGGVGSGTSISNVEVVANQDDGIEWFGGSVDIDGILVWACGDDGLDTDQDWIGTASNFLIITPAGGSAFELDGPEGADARGTHQFDEGYVYAGSNIDHLVDWDGSTNAGISDTYFAGWDAGYVIVADDPMTTDVDESFDPIESFGGDGTGTNSGWQYTLPGGQVVGDVFESDVQAIATAVALNANTVGAADQTGLGWTFAGDSGALTSIGL